MTVRDRAGRETTDGLVSVIIPAYNAEAFIAEAIRSVLNQTAESIELIVVDDGSTDRTLEIAKSFTDPRIRVLEAEHAGVVRARNLGLSKARGEFIAFLDADDYWFPHKLSVQLEHMASEPSVVVVGSLLQYESVSGRALGITGQSQREPDLESVRAGRTLPFPLATASLIRASAIRKVGGFDEDAFPGKTSQAEDLLLSARLAEVGGFSCSPAVLGVYRIHPSSVTARRHREQRRATRFVRAFLAAESSGRTLSWDDFNVAYSETFRQRYGDLVQMYYRRAGLLFGARRWLAGLGAIAVAGVLGPRYTTRRVFRQRFGDRGVAIER